MQTSLNEDFPGLTATTYILNWNFIFPQFSYFLHASYYLGIPNNFQLVIFSLCFTKSRRPANKRWSVIIYFRFPHFKLFCMNWKVQLSSVSKDSWRIHANEGHGNFHKRLNHCCIGHWSLHSNSLISWWVKNNNQKYLSKR